MNDIKGVMAIISNHKDLLAILIGIVLSGIALVGLAITATTLF